MATSKPAGLRDMEELPEGWALTTFEELFDFKGGSQPPKSEFSNIPQPGYIRLLQIRDFESDELAVYIRDSDRWPKCNNYDLMIGRYGASVGKILTGKAGAYNVALVRMIFDRRNLESTWVRHYLNSDYFQQPLRLLSRSAQNGFNKEEVSEFEIPLPPLPEQRRIVAKIEDLTARSRAARTALAEVPTLLEQYRQSLLAAAFRGDLTATWREQHPDTEPASILLERIRQQRRQQWEAKYPKKKYVEPDPVDANDLPELPEGWVWATINSIAEVKGGVTKGRTIPTGKQILLPYLRVANVQDGYLDLREIKHIPAVENDREKYALRYGDILFIEGGSREHLGRGAVWQDNIPECIHQNHIYRARLIGSDILPDFVSLVTKSEFARDYFFSNASQTVNLASINLRSLSMLPIPIPSLGEQKEIIRKISSGYALADIVEKRVNSVLNESELLTQSILAKAFRGELVPQDPNDEPAAALLERIKATAGEAPRKEKRTRR